MHPEVLTSTGANLFPLLSRFPGFYLAGGTALALQIGHRISVDFDLFANNAIERSQLQRVRKVFAQSEIAALINNSDELTLLVDGVKITFLRYPFPPDDAFVVRQGMSLLSIRDIAITKAYTIGRRGSYKDYIDLYFIIAERHATLAEIVRGAERRYGADFNSRLFLEQLVYLGDVEDTDIQFLKPAAEPAQVLAFFADCIRTNYRNL